MNTFNVSVSVEKNLATMLVFASEAKIDEEGISRALADLLPDQLPSTPQEMIQKIENVMNWVAKMFNCSAVLVEADEAYLYPALCPHCLAEQMECCDEDDDCDC